MSQVWQLRVIFANCIVHAGDSYVNDFLDISDDVLEMILEFAFHLLLWKPQPLHPNLAFIWPNWPCFNFKGRKNMTAAAWILVILGFICIFKLCIKMGLLKYFVAKLFTASGAHVCLSTNFCSLDWNCLVWFFSLVSLVKHKILAFEAALEQWKSILQTSFYNLSLALMAVWGHRCFRLQTFESD